MIIAVDFDGTLCRHVFPDIGEPNMKLIVELKRLRSKDVKLILWTCRTGKHLEDALIWCKNFGLEFDAINDDLEPMKKEFGSKNRKIYADIYLDDKAVHPQHLYDIIKYSEWKEK